MASAPMRSHSSPAVLSTIPDDSVIASNFEASFKAGNVNDVSVHGIFHPTNGSMLLFYPEDKDYAIAMAVDKNVYFEWIDKFVRPSDFGTRRIIWV
jgi:hypothetical protein